MANPFLTVSALALLWVQGAAKSGQADDQMTLSQYIASIHWDPAKSGTLIAIDADNVGIDEGAPKTWVGFERKLVKAGMLNVVALSWTIALEDSDLPNAYQGLSDADKLVFLLATLSPPDLAKLTGPGISAKELSGEQRLALLSMIPRPFSYLQGQVHGNNGFQSSEQPTTVPEDQVDQIRLQLRKGMNVSYGASTTVQHAQTSSTLSSLTYRGPDGTAACQSGSRFRSPMAAEFPGRTVPSKEKKSDISWSDPRLAKLVELKPVNTIGDLVAAIRQQNGIELYADIRIAGLSVNAYGSTAPAGDLLRGLALAVGGAVRQVGPAFVLTANLKGKGSAETRLKLHKAMGEIEIRARLAQWRETVAKRGVLDSLPFPADDAFQSGSISPNLFATRTGDYTKGWVSLDQLPTALQNAVNQAAGTARPQRDVTGPVAELNGKVRVSSAIGYRFELPDGRPLENNDFGVFGTRMAEISDYNSNQTDIPSDPKRLPAGSAVGIAGDDPGVVAKLCKQVKAIGASEIWLDSQTPSAIKAAIDSGLKVDLVILPWRILKGERNSEPDRNILGWSGSQLNKLSEARYDTSNLRIDSFADSVSPGAPDLASHWTKLFGIIPKAGIHRFIVLDAEPEGYSQPTNPNVGYSSGGMIGQAAIQPGLKGQVPGLFEFGYLTDLRLQFLRKHQIDPVDITEPRRVKLGPPDPFFEWPMLMGRRGSPYGNIWFPIVHPAALEGLSQDWQAVRHSFISTQVADLVQRLTPFCSSIYLEGPAPIDRHTFHFAQRVVKSGPWEAIPDWNGDSFVIFISMSPQNTENEQGELLWKPFISVRKPFCFDLRDVPTDRFNAYLHYLFNPSK